SRPATIPGRTCRGSQELDEVSPLRWCGKGSMAAGASRVQTHKRATSFALRALDLDPRAPTGAAYTDRRVLTPGDLIAGLLIASPALGCGTNAGGAINEYNQNKPDRSYGPCHLDRTVHPDGERVHSTPGVRRGDKIA